MKIIYNKVIPFGYAKYFNFCGLIFTKSKNLILSDETINHESIHTLQMKYLLYVFFYLIYLLEWLIKLPVSLFCDNGRFSVSRYAYRSISFEQVAYYNENDLTYLNNANPYEWIKYVFKMYDLNKSRK